MDFASLLTSFKSTSTSKTSQPSSSSSSSSSNSKKRKPNSSSYSSSSSSSSSNHTSTFPPHTTFSDFTLNFLCLGAQKGGTTWLHEHLCLHPDLGLPLPLTLPSRNNDSGSVGNGKEVHFFDWNLRKGLPWYRSRFMSTPPPPMFTFTPPPGALIPTPNPTTPIKVTKKYGECTPDYLALSPHIISQIHKLYPRLKLIFIARPLKSRGISAIRMQILQDDLGLKAGEFISDAMIEEQNKKERNGGVHPIKLMTSTNIENILLNNTYKGFSDYAKGLKNWTDVYGVQNIVVLDFKRIASDPKAVIKEVCTFLGVSCEDDFWGGKIEIGKAVNAGIGIGISGAGADSGAGAGVKTKKMDSDVKISEKVEEFWRVKTREFNLYLKEELGIDDWELEGGEGGESEKGAKEKERDGKRRKGEV